MNYASGVESWICTNACFAREARTPSPGGFHRRASQATIGCYVISTETQLKAEIQLQLDEIILKEIHRTSVKECKITGVINVL